MRYALGEKVDAIAHAEHLTSGAVSKIAAEHGLPIRSHRSGPLAGRPDAAAVKRLREHAVILSAHHHRQASRWACAAQD